MGNIHGILPEGKVVTGVEVRATERLIPFEERHTLIRHTSECIVTYGTVRTGCAWLVECAEAVEV